MNRVIALIAVLAFGACTPQQQDDTYAIVCASIPVADQAFQIYAASGRVSANVIANEQLAVAAAQSVCNGPRPADTRTAVAAVQRAMSSILASTKAARTQAGG